jgi:dienelactone hydrolase
MRFLIVLFILILANLSTKASVVTDSILYNHSDLKLKGYVFYDGLLKSKRPGLLLIPPATGYSDFIRQNSIQLAELGYVIFVIDMVGPSDETENAIDAENNLKYLYDDQMLMLERAYLGVNILKKLRNIEPTKLGCIGYGFGGSVAFELARNDAEFACFVSFYGLIVTNNEQNYDPIQGSILFLYGAKDPFIQQKHLTQFQNEMEMKKADWQINIYGNALSGFSNPEHGFEPKNGYAYNYKADKRSWEALKEFLREHLL